ncbi:hypothetical protein QBC38DRAFT_491654 [Podospora fimiseda]|uniref:Uncharacterized protein n=1 Tax=Podospora fimiseda TaxID=252190 RepID=A0AAN6YLU4_9PEZI|nr:hypothetical protein QBC38DRAFT_491654 [Podospora fimiseda]
MPLSHTVTLTVIPPRPVPTTFGLRTSDGLGFSLSYTSGTYNLYALSGTGTSTIQLTVPAAGGQALYSPSPSYAMWLRVTNAYMGIVTFGTNTVINAYPSQFMAVTCKVDPNTLNFNCSAARGLNRFFQCCTQVYLTANVSPATNCVAIVLKTV